MTVNKLMWRSRKPFFAFLHSLSYHWSRHRVLFFSVWTPKSTPLCNSTSLEPKWMKSVKVPGL